MEILLLLVERHGRLVSRQELSQRLWSQPDPEVVKQSINNAINRIRYTLQDTTGEPRYVKTVVGKGYIFVGTLEVLSAQPTTSALEEHPASEEEEASTSHSGSLAAPTSLTLSAEEVPWETTSSSPAGEPSSQPLADSLGSVLPESDRPPSFPSGITSQRRSRFGWPLLLLLLSAAFLLSAVLFGVLRHIGRRHDVAAGLLAFHATRFTNNPNDRWITAAAIAPDGSGVLFAEPESLRFRSTVGAPEVRIPVPGIRVIDRLAWFADSNQFLISGLDRTSGRPGVWLSSRAGFEPVSMHDDARQGIPSPVGAQIAFTDSSMSEVWIMDVLGRAPRLLLQHAPNATFKLLCWMPGGHTLLIQRLQYDARFPAPSWDQAHGVHATYLAVNVANGAIQSSVESIWMEDAVMRSGTELLYTHNDGKKLTLWSVPLDPETGAFRGSPRELQEVHTRSLTAAQDGTLAGVVINLVPRVFVGSLSADTRSLSSVSVVASDSDGDYPHAWAPDSAALYFERKWASHWRIMLQGLSGDAPQPVITSALEQTAPRLTPGHQWLLFNGRVPGTGPYQIYRVPPGGGKPELVHTDGLASDFRCPALRGSCLLTRVQNLQQLTFVTLDPVQGAGRTVASIPWKTTDLLIDWDISPDGRELAIVSPEQSDSSLILLDLSSGRQRKVVLDLHRRLNAVNWDAAGKGWFVSLVNGIGNDLVHAFPDAPPALLRQTTGQTYAVPSPDGRRLSFVDQSTDSNVWLLRL